ncbi:MAG TPA: YggT family protein [Natronosporangium sp.]|jgi:YggT family protein|nr:YggT family protein [Natronosporangium sp.]
MAVGFVVVLQVLYVLLHLFLMVLLGRFVMSWVLAYSRHWHPGRWAAAGLESVWTVTDPPLKALRRVIPPLRIGSVSIDLAALVLLVMLFVLFAVVGNLISSLS